MGRTKLNVEYLITWSITKRSLQVCKNCRTLFLKALKHFIWDRAVLSRERSRATSICFSNLGSDSTGYNTLSTIHKSQAKIEVQNGSVESDLLTFDGMSGLFYFLLFCHAVSLGFSQTFVWNSGFVQIEYCKILEIFNCRWKWFYKNMK